MRKIGGWKNIQNKINSHFKGSSRNKHEKGLYVEHPVTYERKNSILVNKPYSKGSPLIKVQVPKRLQRELPTSDKYIA